MSGQAAKERAEVYKAALQELTLFKSRTSAALLQVHPRMTPAALALCSLMAQDSSLLLPAEGHLSQMLGSAIFALLLLDFRLRYCAFPSRGRKVACMGDIRVPTVVHCDGEEPAGELGMGTFRRKCDSIPMAAMCIECRLRSGQTRRPGRPT